MKRIIHTLLIILCFAFLSSSLVFKEDKICMIINKAKPLSKFEYNTGYHSRIKKTELVKLDEIEFESIYNRKRYSSESTYILGKLVITKNRVGLICYNTAIESDHPIDYITLHIVDSCKKVIETKYLSSEDSDIFIYKRSSIVNRNLDTLTLRLDRSSEWVAGTDSRTDTLFTEVYKFNLKSENIDTVFRKLTYKVVNLK